jgi:hypothetical protein
MGIKIYTTIGLGILVGEKIKQDDEKVYLKHPGVLVPNQKTREGIKNLMAPPVPDFFAGYLDLLREFPLKKSLIVFSGRPAPGVLSMYDNYCTQLMEMMTGIVRVSADAMNNLPKTGEGKPIIQ